MKFSIKVFIFLFCILSISFIACTQAQVVSTKRQDTDLTKELTAPPSTTYISEQAKKVPTTEILSSTPSTFTKKVCHIFISEYGDQKGGMPVLVDSIYLDHDGTIQQIQERNDDIVLELREGKGDILSILEHANDIDSSTSTTGLFEDPYLTGDASTGTVTELNVLFCDTSTKQWSGSSTNIPTPVENVISQAKIAIKLLPLKQLKRGQRLIRSKILPINTVNELRNTKREIIDIPNDKIKKHPLFEEVITHESKLVQIPEGVNPYLDLPISFAQGMSVEVNYQSQVFQIRHLIAE